MSTWYVQMSDANVRIAAAWPFPMRDAGEQLLSAFEFRKKQLPEPLAGLIRNWPADQQEELFSGEDAADAFESLCWAAMDAGIHGVIAIVDCPVFKGHSDGGVSFSWGHYRHKLIFAGDMDQLVRAAADWGNQELAAARANAEAQS